MTKNKAMFLEELEFCKDSFSADRYRWLQGIATKSVDKEHDMSKIYVAMGYIMATREMGKNVGYLKLYLEYILEDMR